MLCKRDSKRGAPMLWLLWGGGQQVQAISSSATEERMAMSCWYYDQPARDAALEREATQGSPGAGYPLMTPSDTFARLWPQDVNDPCVYVAV